MNTISVQLAVAAGKGVAVTFDGQLAEDPTADAYAGVTLEAGSAGDYVACVAQGEEIPCVAGGAIAVGAAIEFGTDGKMSSSSVTNGQIVCGTCVEAASGDGESFRARLAPFYTPSA